MRACITRRRRGRAPAHAEPAQSPGHLVARPAITSWPRSPRRRPRSSTRRSWPSGWPTRTPGRLRMQGLREHVVGHRREHRRAALRRGRGGLGGHRAPAAGHRRHPRRRSLRGARLGALPRLPQPLRSTPARSDAPARGAGAHRRAALPLRPRRRGPAAVVLGPGRGRHPQRPALRGDAALRRAAAGPGGGQPPGVLLAQCRGGAAESRAGHRPVLRRAVRQHLGVRRRRAAAAPRAHLRRSGAGRRAARRPRARGGGGGLGGAAPRADHLDGDEHRSTLRRRAAAERPRPALDDGISHRHRRPHARRLRRAPDGGAADHAGDQLAHGLAGRPGRHRTRECTPLLRDEPAPHRDTRAARGGRDPQLHAGLAARCSSESRSRWPRCAGWTAARSSCGTATR